MLKIGCLLFLLTAVLTLKGNKPTVTIITGYWDISRGEIDPQLRLTKDFFLSLFEIQLQTSTNMIIFGDQTVKSFVQERRNHTNTVFVLKTLQSLRSRWYNQKIRQVINKYQNEQIWKTWMKSSKQSMEFYNTVVMSKLFLMNEAIQYDIFDSDFYAWVSPSMLHDYNEEEGRKFVVKKSIEHMHTFYQNIWYFHLYRDDTAFQDYEQGEFRYLSAKIPSDEVVRGNYFGGRLQVVSTMKAVFENLLRITLQNNDMGTDQCLYSIMQYRYPYLIPLVSKHDAKNLSVGQLWSTQASIYFRFIDHRFFKIIGNENYQSKQFVVNKGVKEAVTGSTAQFNQFSNRHALYNKVKIGNPEIDISPWNMKEKALQALINYKQLSIFYFLPKGIPIFLSQTVTKYQHLLFYRGLFGIVFFWLYYFFSRFNRQLVSEIQKY